MSESEARRIAEKALGCSFSLSQYQGGATLSYNGTPLVHELARDLIAAEDELERLRQALRDTHGMIDKDMWEEAMETAWCAQLSEERDG